MGSPERLAQLKKRHQLFQERQCAEEEAVARELQNVKADSDERPHGTHDCLHSKVA